MPSKNDNPIFTEEIGIRLAALRKKRGLTQVEFAEQLNITQAVVSKYERGEVRLTAPMLVRIAELLRISTDELLGLKNKKKLPEPRPVPGRRLMRRLTRFETLPKRKQEALLQTIDAVLQSA